MQQLSTVSPIQTESCDAGSMHAIGPEREFRARLLLANKRHEDVLAFQEWEWDRQRSVEAEQISDLSPHEKATLNQRYIDLYHQILPLVKTQMLEKMSLQQRNHIAAQPTGMSASQFIADAENRAFEIVDDKILNW
jgi:hypothetical protein